MQDLKPKRICSDNGVLDGFCFWGHSEIPWNPPQLYRSKCLPQKGEKTVLDLLSDTQVNLSFIRLQSAHLFYVWKQVIREETEIHQHEVCLTEALCLFSLTWSQSSPCLLCDVTLVLVENRQLQATAWRSVASLVGHV